MVSGGDPDELRALARRLREWSSDAEAIAVRVRAGAGVQWVSTAADRYRARLAEHAALVDGSREELTQVAGALDALAGELEERQAAIRQAAAVVGDAIDGAKSALSRLWGVAKDDLTDAERVTVEAAHRVLDTVGTTVPPLGAPDWIDLSRKLGR